MRQIVLNTDSDVCVATILAWYYKFGSQTLLLGNYGTTGGAIKVEYEQQKVRLPLPECGGGKSAGFSVIRQIGIMELQPMFAS